MTFICCKQSLQVVSSPKGAAASIMSQLIKGRAHINVRNAVPRCCSFSLGPFAAATHTAQSGTILEALVVAPASGQRRASALITAFART